MERAGDAALSNALAEAFAARAGERDATLTHPFHAYPARLHPDVARKLVAIAVARGEQRPMVLDPCCGSGTVLVEAMVAGCPSLGADLSPLAVELARLKTRLTTEGERKAMVERAHEVARHGATLVRARARIPFPADERRWFAPHTLHEVAALAASVNELRDGFEKDALRMLLSSILVKVSRQRSDSDARPVGKTVAPGAALHFFARKSLELSRCLAALEAATPRHTRSPKLAVDDATALRSVPSQAVDVVIASPPYANTYDYSVQHARRYAWLALDASGLADREMGAARWFADDPEAGALRFERELGSLCAACARVLRPAGMVMFVMADGSAGDRALRADESLALAARHAGLRVAARVSQSRPTFDRASAHAFSKEQKREHIVALVRA